LSLRGGRRPSGAGSGRRKLKKEKSLVPGRQAMIGEGNKGGHKKLINRKGKTSVSILYTTNTPQEGLEGQGQSSTYIYKTISRPLHPGWEIQEIESSGKTSRKDLEY